MSKIIGGSTLLDAELILGKVQVGDKMRVADFGCGASGHFIFAVARIVGKKGKAYAVDILKTVLETINKRAKVDGLDSLETVWTNLEVFGATQIENGSLDIGLLINTLYQSHKRAEILRESIRMIKQGGKLMVVEWKNIATPFGPPTEEKVKKDLLLAGVKKLGLNLEEEFEAGQYHYGLVFVKL